MVDLLAPIIRHLIAPAWACWERSPYLRHDRRLRRTQFDPPEVIRRRQWEQIESLLTSCLSDDAVLAIPAAERRDRAQRRSDRLTTSRRCLC